MVLVGLLMVRNSPRTPQDHGQGICFGKLETSKVVDSHATEGTKGSRVMS